MITRLLNQVIQTLMEALAEARYGPLADAF